MAGVGLIGELRSATDLLRTDTATAGLGRQLPSNPWTTQNTDKNLADKWFVPVGFMDRDVYTTTDNVTIDIAVTTGPKDDPSKQTTKNTVLDETITTIVDPVNGTSTTERIVEQPEVSSTPAATTGTAAASSGDVETTVTVSDQRTTTQTSYDSQISATSPTGTTNTITISNVAHSTQQISENQAFTQADPDATLQSLTQYFANPANLKGLLVGAYAPQFENIQPPILINVQV